jgi:hypothetical protein
VVTGVFGRDVRRFKWRHPLIWRRAKREHALEERIYNALAGVLKAHSIPDEQGEHYEDEPSYDLMVAVMRVLKREKVKF